MTISSFIRAVGTVRIPARRPDTPGEVTVQAISVEQPTSSGLIVSPVHGRHCICERCAPGQLEQLRLGR